MALDLVFLGNLLVDDIVFADGRTLMGEPGGAMLYASLSARLWGAQVGLVSIAGTDYPRATLEGLAARGIDLSGIRELGTGGVRTWLLYEPGVRRVVHRLGCPSHFEVSPEPGDIPREFADARAYHLSPMPIARQRELAAHLARRPGAFVSVDPHEPIREDTLAAWAEVLVHADVFFPGQDEMRLAEAAGDPAAAIDRLASERLRWIVFKRGARGGVLVDRREALQLAWEARAARVVDTTGAGDAFAGGLLAGLLSHGDLARSIEQGVVSASFALEDWGARGLMAATPDAAGQRWREWYGSPVAGRRRRLGDVRDRRSAGPD